MLLQSCHVVDMGDTFYLYWNGCLYEWRLFILGAW